jgi:putative transposase
LRKSRFTDAQIIAVIKEHDAGVATKELCRKHGISANTLYKWKSKFGGMEVSDVTKMRTLQDENRRLRKVVADLVLEKEALKIVAEGNF